MEREEAGEEREEAEEMEREESGKDAGNKPKEGRRRERKKIEEFLSRLFSIEF